MRVRLGGGGVQTAEVYAGGGYLSQSSGPLIFGLGTSDHVEDVEVRWPDGRSTTTEAPTDQRVLLIRQPL